MRRALLAAFLTMAVVTALGSCGDDDDTVATSPDGTQEAVTNTEGDVGAAPTTAAMAEATYEFAVQFDPGQFWPTAVASTDADQPIEYTYAGQVVRLEYIELDPEGPACPTDAQIEVTDATGAVVATGSGSEIEIPEGDVEGPLVATVRCERDGAPGVGSTNPFGFAETLDEVTVAPTTIATGESVIVELAGSCPDGLEGRAGVTPAPDGQFGVIGETPTLEADGSAELAIPEGAGGTFYATVQCYDEDTMTLAVGWAEFEATTS